MNARFKALYDMVGEETIDHILGVNEDYIKTKTKQKGTNMKSRMTTKSAPADRYERTVDDLISCALTLKQVAESTDEEDVLDVTAENAQRVVDACAVIMPHVGKGTQQALEALIASMQTIQDTVAQKSTDRHSVGWIDSWVTPPSSMRQKQVQTRRHAEEGRHPCDWVKGFLPFVSDDRG